MFGSGDSYVLMDLLPPNDETILHTLFTTTPWLTVSHRGNLLPRLVCNQALFTADHKIPIYRHPIDEDTKTIPFTEIVTRICNAIQQRIPSCPPLNHALIQLYRDGNDNIRQHADKTLDVLPNSLILLYSVGAVRTLRLTHKTRKGVAQYLALPPNSVFVMGLQTNREWYHQIRADKRRQEEKRPEELGQRISVTYRSVATYIDEKTRELSGQGAQKIYVDPETERQNMLTAFSEENRNPDFDWNKHYGNGFTLTCIKQEEKKDIWMEYYTPAPTKTLITKQWTLPRYRI